jgi:DNA processing protein
VASFSPRDLIVLSRIPGIGCLRLRNLVNRFGDRRAIALASAREIAGTEGIDRKAALAISRFLRSPAAEAAGALADDQLRRLARASGRIVTLWDDEYPSHLKCIYDPPAFLFVRGGFLRADDSSLAIVGTRSPTPHGSAIAERFAAGMAHLGLTVVSGLARGIDTAAHNAALRAGGRTLAVIGSGIDVIYPAENTTLAARIAEQGAVVSEYLMGARPDAVNFPRRNRIISGICLGTLIVESGVNGGAMITAATALDQNREVFAIPSALSERPSGTNRLIKEGKALLTESFEDILAELGPRLKSGAPPSLRPAEDFSLFERRIYDAMEEHPLHIDQLAARSRLTTADTLVHLLSLESKGAVRQMAGRMFVKT